MLTQFNFNYLTKPVTPFKRNKIGIKYSSEQFNTDAGSWRGGGVGVPLPGNLGDAPPLGARRVEQAPFSPLILNFKRRIKNFC